MPIIKASALKTLTISFLLAQILRRIPISSVRSITDKYVKIANNEIEINKAIEATKISTVLIDVKVPSTIQVSEMLL